MLLAFAMLLPACGSGPAPADVPDAALPIELVDRALPTLSAATVESIRTAQDGADATYAFRHLPTGAWSAPQPHALNGVSLDADTVVVGDDVLRLRFDAIGRTSGHAAPVAARSLRVRDQRATTGASAVEVWFANGPLGLEHGATLASAPAGEGHLVVTIDTSVPAHAASSSEGDGLEVTFTTTAGVVRYYGPSARDARGTALPAGFVVENGALTLEVDDEGATYPVEIDPLVTTQSVLASPEAGQSDYMGDAAAISGEWAVLGALGDDDQGTDAGAAFVFRRVSGTWSLFQTLRSSDGAAAEAFGTSVAVSSDTIAVGAPVDNGMGAVFVWSWNGSVWAGPEKIVPASALATDRVGQSVALSGTTLAFGANMDDETPGVNCGSVYVYLRDGLGVWNQQAKLVPTGLLGSAQLGISVAIQGDRLASGAYAQNGSRGAVFVLDRTGTTWALVGSPIVPADVAAADLVGRSVAIDGNTLLFGAYRDDDTVADSGSAYVFVWNGAAWTQEAKLHSPTPTLNWYWGWSVALNGDQAFVGAVYALSGGFCRFVRTGTTWGAPTVMAGTDTIGTDYFGRAVAIDGTNLLVGVAHHDYSGVTNVGAGYVFTYDTSWTQQAELQQNKLSGYDKLGSGLSLDGSTIAVGAPYDDDAATDAGAVYIFVESAGVWTLQQKIVPTGATSTELFGASVAVAGDNLVVGAPYADDAATDSGAAYVFARSAGVWTQTARLKWNDPVTMVPVASDRFGFSVDIGPDAIAVGAPYDDTPPAYDKGIVALYDLAAGIPTFRNAVQASDGAGGDGLGYQVALDGDRLAASAIADDDGASQGGVLFVFSRAAPGSAWSQLAKLVPVEPAGNTRVNDLVGVSLDINHDLAGNWTVAAGSVNDTQVATAAGAVWSFTSPSSTFATTTQQKLMPADGAASWRFGTSVDIDGTSLAVGAYSASSSRGRAYLFHRAGGEWRFDPPAIGALDLPTSALYFGQAVALEGNRLAVGAPLRYAPDTYSGAVYVQQMSGYLGDACTLGTQCGTGFCVDGVCCDTACGGGAVDDCQACSTGLDGTLDGTCTSLKADAAPLVMCRAVAGVCDVADYCVAGNPVCVDTRVAVGIECRAQAGFCDVAEQCDGSAECPPDAKSTAECRAQSDSCDAPELCDGVGDTCPTDVLWFAGYECRSAAGTCDIAETCSGSSATCPADSLVPADTDCRPPVGPCDIAEKCSGTVAACPADVLVEALTVCRAAAGVCDVAESCTGAQGECPADGFESDAVTCRARASLCDAIEMCTGTDAYCPTDLGSVAGAWCRDDLDGTGCDDVDVCDGVNYTSCPDDTLSNACELEPDVSIAAGRYHTCAIRADGTLYCWGDNTFGQLGLNSTTASLTPAQVGTATNWETIAAGAFHTCATNTAGEVYCWGRNDRGQAGVAPSAAVLVPTQLVSLAGGTAVALGDFHSCVLLYTGAVSCWGANPFGQLGNGLLTDSYAPVAAAGTYTQVAAGSNHSCAIAADGVVSCWGSNATGQIGSAVSVGISSPIPVAVPGLPSLANEKATRLAAGGPRTCVIYKAHRVACWGSNAARRAGDALGYSTTPVDMELTGAADITLGESHLCVRNVGGEVVCWGDNRFGQLGDESAVSRWLTPPSTVVAGGSVVSVVTGHMHACAVLYPVAPETIAPVVCWGRGEEGQLGDGNDFDRVRVAERVKWSGSLPVRVAGGWSHTCAMTSSGDVSCWGDARYGATGTDLTDGVRYLPTAIGVSTAENVFAGDGFSCAKTYTSGVVCWGRNDRGQVGQPTCTSEACDPASVAGLTNVVSAAVGRAHVCAIGRMSGDVTDQLYCWGANGEGQLGDGTLVDSRTPIRVTLPYPPFDLTAGESHTCVIAEEIVGGNSTYHVYCWGRNSEGQAGDGTFGGDLIPYVPPEDTLDAGVDFGVPPDAGVTFSRLLPQHVGTISMPLIRAGRNYTCTANVVLGIFELNCWGKNTHGELGDGTRVHRNVPTLSQVAGTVNGLMDLAAGEAFMCIAAGTGSNNCWGRNDAAQLGDRTLEDHPTFTVPVAGLSSVVGLGNGLAHACAITGGTDPGLYCWGRNEYGQIGNRAFRANRVVPAAVRWTP